MNQKVRTPNQTRPAFRPWSLQHNAPSRTGRRLTLRNRIVMAPMTRRQAKEDGIPTPQITEYYCKRAAGEVGLIISEGIPVDSIHAYDAKTVPRFETETQLAGWKEVVEAVHNQDGSFAPQLWHCGRLAENPIGPSNIPTEDRPQTPDGSPRPPVRAMNEDDFKQVINAFETAAQNAEKIGCDAIELHGAHGYLLDSFLSRTTNNRTDDFGGSLENRMRFPIQVLKAVRAVVSPDFPIIYRFSQWRIDEYEDVKFNNPDELSEWVNALKDAGADILHVSTRNATNPGFPDHDTTRTLAGWTRKLAGLPVIAVGKISVTLTMDQAFANDERKQKETVTDPAPAFSLLEKGEADLLAIGRSLITNPDWVQIVRDQTWKNLKPFNPTQLATLE